MKIKLMIVILSFFPAFGYSSDAEKDDFLAAICGRSGTAADIGKEWQEDLGRLKEEYSNRVQLEAAVAPPSAQLIDDNEIAAQGAVVMTDLERDDERIIASSLTGFSSVASFENREGSESLETTISTRSVLTSSSHYDEEYYGKKKRFFWDCLRYCCCCKKEE